MSAEPSRMRLGYEIDSDALSAIYERAYAKLARRYRMDDDCKSKLVTVVLKAYFDDTEGGAAVDIEPLITATVATFDGLMSAEH